MRLLLCCALALACAVAVSGEWPGACVGGLDEAGRCFSPLRVSPSVRYRTRFSDGRTLLASQTRTGQALQPVQAPNYQGSASAPAAANDTKRYVTGA
jgi:hypothetical protein